MESNKVDVIIATPGHSMDAAYVRSLVETIHVLEQVRGLEDY